jgi:hypothetical protein
LLARGLLGALLLDLVERGRLRLQDDTRAHTHDGHTECECQTSLEHGLQEMIAVAARTPLRASRCDDVRSPAPLSSTALPLQKNRTQTTSATTPHGNDVKLEN